MLGRGSIVLLELGPTRGREQRGVRPCVVVSDPRIIASQRYRVAAVVPISTTEGHGALYPPLQPGPSGLRRRSWALTDQVRAVDKGRFCRVFGRLTPEEMEAVDEGLRLFLGL